MSDRYAPIVVDSEARDELIARAKMRALVAERMVAKAKAAETQDPTIAAELERCRQDFRYFLRYWRFKNRESGEVAEFGEWDEAQGRYVLRWEGQEQAAQHMVEHPWLFLLKAGKLGFTELECAYDGWVARFRQPNARVHIFSRIAPSAVELLDIVRFGLRNLPPWMRWPLLAGEPGGDTTQSMKLRNPHNHDDIRHILSYPSTSKVAIEATATHNHVDEFAHMQDPEGVWGSISTTVAPEGTCHIVTRGHGENYARTLWNEALNDVGRLKTYFAPWHMRPRPDNWYVEESGSRTMVAQQHFAPETVDDAFAEDMTDAYIPIEIWDRRAEAFGEIGPKEACVLALDAGVSSDNFGMIAATRHPERHDEPCLRWSYLLKPQGGEHVSFEQADAIIRKFIEEHNCIVVVYDPYQLEGLAQAWKRDHLTYIRAFDQGKERLQADAAMFQRAMNGTMSHNGDPSVRQHIGNAVTKLQKDDDSKMRIVKRSPEAKVDLAVCASMACWEIMRLNL